PLLERIERQRAQRDANCRLGGAGVTEVSQQLGQRVHGELAEPLPLAREPFLEGWLAHVQSFEEIPAIERGRPLKRLGSVGGQSSLDGADVDIDRRRREGARARLADDDVPACGRERFAERAQCLPQAGPGLTVTGSTPEEAGELVPGLAVARAE